MAVTRAGSRKQAQNERKYTKRGKRSNLRQPISIKGPLLKRHIPHTHFTRYAKNQLSKRRIINRLFFRLKSVDGGMQFEWRKRIIQSKPGQTTAQMAQGAFPPYLARAFSRTRTERERGRVPRKANFGGNTMTEQVEPILNEEVMRFMHELGIPILPPDCDWIQEECLKHLNWEINLLWAMDSLELSKQNDFPPHTSEAVQDHSSSCGIPSPLGRFPLTDDPALQHHGSNLEKERRRMRDRMLHGSLQIPSDWTPIRDIHPPESMDIREGTLISTISDEDSDSARLDLEGMYKRQLEQDQREELHSAPPSSSRPTNKSGNVSPRLATALEGPATALEGPATAIGIGEPRPDFDRTIAEARVARHLDAFWNRLNGQGSPKNGSEIDENDIPNLTKPEASSSSTPPDEGSTIKFVPRLHEYMPTLVHDWEMLVATRHYSFIWRYQEPEVMRTRARSRHVRVFSTSQPLLNSDTNLPGAVARMVALHGGDTLSIRETRDRYILGHFLADMTATEAIPAYCSFRKKTLPGWKCPSTPVLLDIACFPSREALPWDERAAPLLLAAQFSKGVGGHDRMAADPLACAFHSTLIVLILYYLDTRSREGDSLPSWMVVYGIIYTKNGFSIHEHYPVYHPRAIGKPGRWGAASTLAVRFADVFDPRSPPQSQPISALMRISGHAQFILETLRRWDGYQRIIAPHFIP